MKSQDWIDQIAPVIAQEANKRGYLLPAAIITQAHVESWKSAGNISVGNPSKLASKYYNLFGMKCGKHWKGKSVNMDTKEEYTIGTLTDIKSNFRAYDSLEEGIAGYFDFIQCPRYSNLKKAQTVEEYFELLKEDGWATSSVYVNTLKNRYKKLGLDSYNISPVPVYGFTPGLNYTTTVDLYIREAPNGAKKSFNDITIDAKNHSDYDDAGMAILRAGTVVTCKEVRKLISSIWIRIPSGWICARSAFGKLYIQ